jgi:hypothetical protein
MTAIDQRFERTDVLFAEIREEMRGMRAELSQLKDSLIQIGFALVGVHITGITALVIVAID